MWNIRSILKGGQKDELRNCLWVWEKESLLQPSLRFVARETEVWNWHPLEEAGERRGVKFWHAEFEILDIHIEMLIEPLDTYIWSLRERLGLNEQRWSLSRQWIMNLNFWRRSSWRFNYGVIGIYIDAILNHRIDHIGNKCTWEENQGLSSLAQL